MPPAKTAPSRCLPLRRLFTRTPGRTLLGGLLAAFVTGAAAETPLRVGVTPDYPPIIFKKGDQMAGVEAELSQELGKQLKVPIEFVELKFTDLIPALLDGRINIIMSGMSVTAERKYKVRFAEPYHQTGLMVLMRRKDAELYRTPDDMLNAVASVGFKKGTVAESFVREKFQNARKMTYDIPNDAALDVQRKKLDLFVHDGPAIGWLASTYEGDLTGLFQPLTDDSLAWAVARDQEQLLEAVNVALSNLKADGTLDRILDRHLPYRKATVAP
jgi:ABC-type amino acid transport substrate-binding protein